MRLCSKSPACNRTPAAVAVLLIAAAIIIATYGQKTWHWQLRMYNCNFEVNKLGQQTSEWEN